MMTLPRPAGAEMLQPGEIIDGKYRIVRLLGQGGMGGVYEGENTRIHRKVAIKVLHAGVAAKADVVQRFEREAQAAGRIGSEHIVEVLDLGNLPSGERFMVMEFLEGESLGERIKKRKRLPVQEVGPITHQLLQGLAAAHQAGIIHRDLKPDNVFLLATRGGQRDFVKILDFGVSKFSALDADSMSMTKTGAVMGTPYYMSPEQARGSKIDQRSDLYSVGVVMYQAVTGRVPFAAETFNELVFKIALESPDPAELVVPNLDPGVATIIARAMIRDVNLRFQSAQEFQAAVQQWLATGAAVQTPMPGPSGHYPGAQPSYGGFGAQTPQGGVTPYGQQGYGRADASGPHAAMLGTSPVPGQPMGGSGPYGMGQMQQSSPHLSASQAGLAMTAPQPRNNGAMIVIGLIGTLVLAGGAFGVYKLVSGGSAAAGPPPSAAPSAPIPVETAAPTATTTATAAPVETATPVPTAEASATPTSAPTGRVGGPLRKPPTATPTATTAPRGTGRVIGGDL